MTPSAEIVPTAVARRLFLCAQGLADDPARAATPASVYRLVERMGFVQMDSIQAVERAHHLILAARLDGYRPAMLARLLERDRRLFEHWTHDAAAIPTRWFAHWRPRFARARDAIARDTWWRERLGPDAGRIMQHVRDRIRAEGPLQAKDFEQERNGASGAWWGWTPQKAALEFLWHTGELLISRRVQFQKVYDLAERVLPDHAGAGEHAVPEHDWAFAAALERLVIATPGELARFWGKHDLADARRWCEAACARGEAVPVRVEGTGDVRPQSAFAPPDWRTRATRAGDVPARLRLLAPFDPILHDRARTRRLFGFDYAFEAFTPATKRRFGYYVLPILDGEHLVGRADAARDDGRLVLRRVWWEPGIRPARARIRALRDATARLAACIGLEA